MRRSVCTRITSPVKSGLVLISLLDRSAFVAPYLMLCIIEYPVACTFQAPCATGHGAGWAFLPLK